jgi:DNA-3-methyladenine glycosylase
MSTAPSARLPVPERRQVSEPLPCAFFARTVVEVARDLLGCTFLYGGVGGRVVEVEAYRNDDPASHTFRGRTPRNAVMFGPPGRLYVYFTMGLHFCVNVVCQGEGEAAAVLLRALEPTVGLETMRARRGMQAPRQLCSGPAKLTQALGITRADNGLRACADEGDGVRAAAPASDAVVRFLSREGVAAADPGEWGRHAPRIVATPRIGVTLAADTPWRFVDGDSPFLSRPLPRAGRS